MQLFLRRVLVAFLAAWMPFCCCQVRAAARAIAHASHERTEAAASERHACCATVSRSCCVDGQANIPHADADDAAEDCCGSEPTSHDSGCCAGCKERIGPTAPPISVPEIESELDASATALLALVASEPISQGRTNAATHIRRLVDTGPPRTPTARDTLALHATLVI